MFLFGRLMAAMSGRGKWTKSSSIKASVVVNDLSDTGKGSKSPKALNLKLGGPKLSPSSISAALQKKTAKKLAGQKPVKGRSPQSRQGL